MEFFQGGRSGVGDTPNRKVGLGNILNGRVRVTGSRPNSRIGLGKLSIRCLCRYVPPVRVCISFLKNGQYCTTFKICCAIRYRVLQFGMKKDIKSSFFGS